LLGFVAAGFVRLSEVDLLDEFSEKVLVKIVAESLG
jgi:hypothetical protein